MKHGISGRKLSRPTAHRLLMLRNLVSSLLQHQQVKTTLAKAKEAQPLAEKMITLAKRGGIPARREIEAFVLNPKDTVPLLLDTYAARYKYRPGGYTRIHKYGHRPGDNAPVAILELVDNPQDIKFAVTARAVGRETLGWFLQQGEREQEQRREAVAAGAAAAAAGLELPALPPPAPAPAPLPEDITAVLREKTRWNREKVLKYRGAAGAEALNGAARAYVNQLLAEPEVLGELRTPKWRARERARGAAAAAAAAAGVHEEEVELAEAEEEEGAEEEAEEVDPAPNSLHRRLPGRRHLAGERLTGMDVRNVGLGIAAGALGRKKWAPPRMARREEAVGWAEDAPAPARAEGRGPRSRDAGVRRGQRDESWPPPGWLKEGRGEARR